MSLPSNPDAQQHTEFTKSDLITLLHLSCSAESQRGELKQYLKKIVPTGVYWKEKQGNIDFELLSNRTTKKLHTRDDTVNT